MLDGFLLVLDFIPVGGLSLGTIFDRWNQSLQVRPVAAVEGEVRLRNVHLHPGHSNS